MQNIFWFWIQHCMWIRILIQVLDDQKLKKKIQLKFFLFLFWSQIAIYLSLGLFYWRPCYLYRRNLQPSKENFQHFKNIFTSSYFCEPFLLSWIRIQGLPLHCLLGNYFSFLQRDSAITGLFCQQLTNCLYACSLPSWMLKRRSMYIWNPCTRFSLCTRHKITPYPPPPQVCWSFSVSGSTVALEETQQTK